MADEIIDPGDLDTPSPDAPEPHSIPTTERPRNPDGTFAAFAPHLGSGQDAGVPSSQHPISLVEEARDFGFDDDEINGMTTPVLHKTLWKAKRQIEANRQRSYDFQAREAQRVRIEPERREPLPEPDDDDFDLGVDEEELHPKVIQAMKKLGGGYKKEIKALRGELAERDQRDRERSARRSVSLIDAAFNTLPEYKKLFGEGSGLKLGADSPAMKRRLAVLREAGVDVNEPVSVPELRARIKEAAAILFTPDGDANPYDQPASSADGKAKSEPEGRQGKGSNGRVTREQWNNGALARPTQRKVGEQPKTAQEREAQAVANLAAKLRGEGGDRLPDAEELDGFPD